MVIRQPSNPGILMEKYKMPQDVRSDFLNGCEHISVPSKLEVAVL